MSYDGIMTADGRLVSAREMKIKKDKLLSEDSMGKGATENEVFVISSRQMGKSVKLNQQEQAERYQAGKKIRRAKKIVRPTFSRAQRRAAKKLLQLVGCNVQSNDDKRVHRLLLALTEKI